jgi:hypothetical protein
MQQPGKFDEFDHEWSSSFFCLVTKESKSQGLQNVPAQILTKNKCGQMISDFHFVLID